MKIELKKGIGHFSGNLVFKMYIDGYIHQCWDLKRKKEAFEYFDNYEHKEPKDINEVIKTRTI